LKAPESGDFMLLKKLWALTILGIWLEENSKELGTKDD
jgi:hypothetical protein